jgi:dTDP-4-amino-4,6-dideoxygalactose transaminase
MASGGTNPIVTKGATDKKRFCRPALSFPNARTAFKAFLLSMNFQPDQEVLLPAYIGWSPNEGSGVFDPISDLGLGFRFYRINRNLSINVDDVLGKITTYKPKLFVAIHYFGYPDTRLSEIVDCARENGVAVLEDEAHALFSDLIGGICGRRGNAVIVSLHKMLPFRLGGLLVFRDSQNGSVMEKVKSANLDISLEETLLNYDLLEIAGTRRKNAIKLLELLKPLSGKIDPLFPMLPEGVVPQSLPVIIKDKSRDELYFELNDRGFGAVSLYHTLIDAIPPHEFPDSHWLSKHIMNLPVHQDVTEEMQERMVDCLKSLV